jgi:hypothetical protein
VARNQKNFAMFKYVDDNAVEWNVRGESGGSFTAVDGHATDYTKPAWGKMTRARHVRYVVAQDPTTFRTVKGIVYTPTAFAAIGLADAVNVNVEGSASTVVYNVSAKIAEKQPAPHAPRQLADT